ncbi:MAG: hypothetical protein ACM3II_13795 [Rhodospirillaceae bacterium]
MICCGIDPGLDGALAVIEDGPNGGCKCFDMPTLALSRGGKNKHEVDAHALADLIAQWMPHHAFLEGARAMPGQGDTSTFAIGKGYGIVIGVLAASSIPYTIVDARRWKNALQVPKDKDAARARASQLLPAAASQWPLKKHDGRAEAALIALYGSRSLAGIGRAA